MKTDQAEKELQKVRVENWQQPRLASAQKLPATLRKIARTLIGTDDDGTGLNYEAHHQLREEMRPLTGQLSSPQRKALFEVLFPGLGSAVEAGWQLLRQLPYQPEHREAKSFRAPNHAAALAARRLDWLESLLDRVGLYPGRDLVWHAAWAGHDWNSDALTVLLAAAIDGGGSLGDEIFEILRASAQGEHEVGVMGHHVVTTLLRAGRPDGWEFIEKMLLAAQREEGLRQTILEAVDLARPEAFRRMLKLIQAHNLVRFSATVRAFNVWLGYRWDSVSAGVVNQVIARLELYLEKPSERAAAWRGSDPENAYLALWAVAFDDAEAAIAPATELLRHRQPESRFVAAHLLSQLDLPEAQLVLLQALDDDDLHLPYCALQNHRHGTIEPAILEAGLFERVEKVLRRFPAKATKLKPLVWPWTDFTVDREIASVVLLQSLGARPVTNLIPHLPELESSERAHALRKLAEPMPITAPVRAAFLAWVGDGTHAVRQAALAGLEKCELDDADAPGLEVLLTRTNGDLRRGIIGLLLRLPDHHALASADRLLSAGSAPQRLAGLELLRQLTDSQRCVTEARARVATYRIQHPRLANDERSQIENIENARTTALTLDDGLGLFQHADRTWPARPVARQVALHSAAAVRLLSALDDLVHQHRETSITMERWNNETVTMLLGEASHGLPDPKPERPLDQDRARLPLIEIWEEWWTKRAADLRDADGAEALRAWTWSSAALGDEFSDKTPIFRKRCPAALAAVIGNYKKPKLRYEGIVRGLLKWMIRLHPPTGMADLVLDALETAWSHLPESELRHKPKEDDYDDETWREEDGPFMVWNILSWLKPMLGNAWTPQHSVREFRLFRWRDEPFGRDGTAPRSSERPPRERPEIELVLAAHHAGGATDADILDQLLGERPASRWSVNFGSLRQLTSRRGPEMLKANPRARALVDRCRARVLEVELARGDTPTPASIAALNLGTVWGIPNLIATLRALGDRNFTRGYTWDKDTKESVLSRIVRSTFPAEGETVRDFKNQIAAAGIPELRLVELAVYAPQWAPSVEHALGWPGLIDGVWWIHAHTRGTDWTVEAEIRELWQADLSQRTTLTSAELLEGAVDVAWFKRVHELLGAKRWTTLDDAARYASTGAGHARARLFADAMLGRVRKSELTTRANQKRHQDSVRALGLLPLAPAKAREKDLLDRYKLMQEFIRTSRQFGSQRQASEKRAAQIGQENLARTAGYPDPIRLQWAMEARAVADLADGPIAVTVEGVTVTLAIQSWGEIDLSVARDGIALADIPAKLKKHKAITALRERRTELKRQASRIRAALEQFMCRGESVTATELREMMSHPLLAPMLRGLVLVGEGVAGYPLPGGRVLEDHAGRKEALKSKETVRIAHPVDLLPSAQWHAWQKDCFARERIQPFKQVFREYYPLTKPERDEGTSSRRYAGHQVQPRKALALLGARGWVHHPEEGVRKTYHDIGITAWLEFAEPWFTPAEVEGLTLERVRFTKKGGHEPLKLSGLPPRVFSETMRDLDLVVSVAHRGGVDPEASASTLEMRATLVRETCALLKLTNVRVKDHAVLIRGELGEYSIHLGSGGVRKIPGEALLIVAVQAQHRGRLFLPFTDDDPRTAEVMSKVLLLARDREIKDPGILQQLRT